MQRPPRAKRPRRDALELLRNDHDLIVELFDRFAHDGRTREAGSRLLEEACRAFEVHAQIEQEIFYPAVREAIECREWLEEGEVEHRTIDVLVEELRGVPPGEPRSLATATVLAELLRHHLAKEERRIFPEVRHASVDLAGLGELLRSRQRTILEQQPGNGFRLPPGVFRPEKNVAASARGAPLTGRRKTEGGRRRGYSGLAPF